MLNVAVWLAATAAASLLATSQLGRPTAAVPGRAGALRMGVTDRMATNGILYDAWGAEGMRVLNKTAAFQKASGALEVSHYDAVLMVAARAKQNAYEHAEVSAAPPLRFALTVIFVIVVARTRTSPRLETDGVCLACLVQEAGTGYIGSSFGGNMGQGVRKKKPAKSEVVSAIEELVDEYEASGKLPELVTPGIPQDVLDQWAEEEAAEEAALMAAAVAKKSLAAQKKSDRAAAAASAAAKLKALSQQGALDDDEEEEGGEGDEDEDEDDVVVDEDDDYVLASLLGEDDFEDDVLLEDEDVEAVAKADGAARGSGRPAAGDDAFDDDELADLFGSVGMSRDGAVEASGMSPGDAG